MTKRSSALARWIAATVGVAAALCAAPRATSSAAQAPAAERRLARVPAPVGPNGSTEELYAGSYALLVGVSRYDHPEAWPALDSIPREMTELAGALKRSGFDQVEQVSNTTGQDLRRAVEAFINRYGYDRRNRLVFFFSGHGYSLDNGERGYFVPRDAPDPVKDDAGFRRVALSMQQLTTWAGEMTARHALFAFDSCFSGTIFRTREAATAPPARLGELTSRPVREFLSAGSAGETVPAQSVFTPAFIRALRGDADLDADGFVTGTELGNFVQREVIAYRTRQTPQFGKIRDVRLDEGDLVFAVPRPAGAAGAPAAGAPGPRIAPDKIESAFIDDLIADCDRGNGLACRESGDRYRRGYGVPIDARRAVALFQRGCDNGAALSCRSLGYMYTSGIGIERDDVRAADLYQRACDGADAGACTNLGRVYQAGLGLSQDLPRAVAFYRRGCDGGDALGCANLGLMYENGWGVPVDAVQALALYRRGCESGNQYGCTDWGSMVARGQGTARDDGQAISLFQKGCEGGDARGCTSWGSMIEQGRGSARDDVRAAALYQRGCQGGDAAGCRSWAMSVENGRGVSRDVPRALELYRRACEQKDEEACRSVSRLSKP